MRRFELLLFTLAFGGLAGCQGVPQIQVAQEMALATGVGVPIAFEVDDAPLDAESAAPDDSLSQADAVRFALTRDPRVQSALANVQIAMAEARQSRLLPNPVLNVALRFPEGGGPLQIDAGLSADLLSLLRKPGEISAADHRLRAAAADAVVVALDVMTETQETYAEAQALNAQVGVLDKQIGLNTRLLQLARDRREAGESSQLDVLSLDAQRIELEIDAIQRRADAVDHRLRLARLIGRPSDQATWVLDPFHQQMNFNPEERSWIDAALQNRPEAQARQWELAALGDEAGLAGFMVWNGSEIGVEAERDGEWSVGPAISAPITIFDWGHAHKDKAKAQQIEARHRAVQSKRQIVEDVRRAMARLRSALIALDQVESRLLPVQLKRHDQVEQAYRSGLADITALLVAEQDLLTSRARLINLQRETAIAVARLHRAVGGSGVASSLSPSPTTSRTQP